MDLLVLAAGRGTRLQPLTDTIPKPLIPVAGKGTLLQTLDMVPKDITRIILIVGYLHHQIQAAVGQKWNGRPVFYVIQHPLDGTGGALRQARSLFLTERFMVVNGDDLYGPNDLTRLSRIKRGILVKSTKLTREMNDVCLVQDGKLTGFNRLPRGSAGSINTGAYLLGHEWFETTPVFTPGKTDEWSLPHALPQLFDHYEYEALEADFWMPCGTVEEIHRAENALRQQNGVLA